MKDNFLFDEYMESGKSLTELETLLRQFDKSTRVETVRKNDLTIYSLMEKRVMTKRAKSTSGKIVVVSEKEESVNDIDDILNNGDMMIHVLSPKKIWNYTENGVPYLSTTKVHITPYLKYIHNKKAFINEILKNKMMIGYGKDLFFVSENYLPTFGMRVDMSGRSLLENNLERNIHIANLLNTDEEMSLIIRNNSGVDKIYAALSAKYTYIPQSILINILKNFDPDKKLGKMVCNNWSVSHGITRIELEFPEKAEELQKAYKIDRDLIPGIILEKSDVGECSITVKGTWRFRGMPMVETELKRKHTGKIDIEALTKDAQNIIFANYTKLPERLCELMAIDITDPAWRTLSKKQFRELNKDVVSNTLKSVFKQIDLIKLIAKKNEKALFEAMCDEIDPDMSYTAYDLCLMILNAPARTVGLSSVYFDNYQKAVGKAPYVSYCATKPKKIILV